MHYAALVIGGSFLIEGISHNFHTYIFGVAIVTMLLILGASLLVAINAVKKGAAAEGMKVWDYIWQGHDPTSVAVMTEVNLCCIQLKKCLAFLSMCFKLNAFI